MKNYKILFVLVSICCINLNLDIVYTDWVSNPRNIKEKEVVKIGYSPNYGTINEPYIKGNEGFGYEYFEKISEYTNDEYEYIPCTWEDGFEMLEKGEIDIFGPVGKTNEREEKYLYPENEFGYEDVFLSAIKESNYLYNDVKSINGKTVGLEIDSSHKIFLEDFMEEKNLKFEFIEINEVSEKELIESRDFELRLTGSLHNTSDYKVVANIGKESFYYVTAKENHDLMKEIDSALEAINLDDPYFSVRLHDKYFSSNKMAKPRLTEDEIDLLQSKEVYRIGFDPSHEPFQFIDEDGGISGISIDILNLIAQDAGINIEYVPIDTDTDEEIDLCIGLRDEHHVDNFTLTTNEYLDLPIMAVGDSVENRDDNVLVGVLNYEHINQEYLSSRIVNEANSNASIKVYEHLEDMRKDLEQGKLNYILASNIACDSILTSIGKDDYSIYYTGMVLPFYINISSHMSEKYVPIFNKLIKRIDEQEIESIIIDNTLEFKPDLTIKKLVEENIVDIALSVIGATIIASITVLYMSTQKRKVLTKIVCEDRLTGLLSEYKFIKEVQGILKNSKPNQYMLVAIDIDNFKYVNEVYGYEKGSRILKSFSTMLVDCYKEAELIARIESDKFVVLIDSLKVKENEKLHGDIFCADNIKEITKNILGENYKLNISKGVYIIDNPSASIPYMIDCANSARKLGKEVYGNTNIVFSEEMQDKRDFKNIVVTRMEEALIKKEFTIRLQPKFDLKSNKLAGAEALVRWIPEDEAQIFPDEFIPIFEKNGFIAKLDCFVFEEVCSFIKDNIGIINLPTISINLSGRTILKGDIVETLLNLAKKYEVDVSLIELEITESAIIKNFDKAIEKINELKGLGFNVSMDDFGSGISSLNRLKDINVDILKIDKEFLSDTLGGERGVAIIENIIRMSKQLNLITVAEGVETKNQAKLLKDLGCDIAQGYYFSKPVPKDEFLEIIYKANI